MESITIKKLNYKKDVTLNYLKWMNDPEVQKYTEQKYKKKTIIDIKKFVKEKNKSKNEFLFGIYLKENKKKNHIGNIKLGPINFIHKTAEISYFIGEKDLWGKGYTSEAIKKIINFAKKKKLKKLKACFYEMNHGSKKVLENNGFKIEGKFKSEIIFNKKRYSSYWYGKIL
jgi:ribosomal-protein-alanine N-acetyltransferase